MDFKFWHGSKIHDIYRNLDFRITIVPVFRLRFILNCLNNFEEKDINFYLNNCNLAKLINHPIYIRKIEEIGLNNGDLQ